MPKSSSRRHAVAVIAVALAALSTSCGTSPQPDRPAAGALASPSVPPSAPVPSVSPAGDASSDDGSSSEVPTPGPERVRDAFAGLQATLNDSCDAPGGCAYFLGRVYEELHGLGEAMKADPKGPGHFPEPIAWIKTVDAKLGGDLGAENLKKHQALLTGTRDKVNTWMQGHPDDYR